MQRLWKYYRRYWPQWTWGCLMLLLTNAAAMTIPQLFRFAVDAMKDGLPLGHLRGIAVNLVLFATAGACFRVLSRVNIFFVGRDVEMDIRVDFYRHLTVQQPSFFRRQSTGDLLSRATADLPQVRLLLGPGILNVVNTMMAYASAVPLMAMISVKLTLMSLACFPPALLVMRQLGRALYHNNRRVRERAGDISHWVQENLAGAHVVRAFANQERQYRIFEKRNRAYYDANVRLAWARSGLFRLGLTMANIAILVALYFGSREILELRLTIGELVALVEYMALLAWPTLALGWILSMWQRGSAAMSRISEIIETSPTIVPGTLRPDTLEPSIVVREVTVELEGRRILDGLSFDVPSGATVGLVGPIGSGKSVMVQALLRLVELDGGQILVGGRDITELDLEVLRASFGYVPQDHVLFSKSLLDNVAFGQPNATRREVHEVLARAAFAPDLQALPMGLDTPVGERGLTLSGGQKQRASIARALLLDPSILLLDDALSSLDAETEKEILERLRSSREGRTTLIVSHRVSAVQHADDIVVLEAGRVVERGKHAQLLARDGLYAQMVRRQELERDLEQPARAAGALP